jgi:hypothetical protein
MSNGHLVLFVEPTTRRPGDRSIREREQLMAVMETCAECGFDAADYTRDDLLGTLRAIAPIWRTMTEHVDAEILAARPVSEVWSALEYVSHSRDITAVMNLALRAVVEQDGIDFGGVVNAGGAPATPSTIIEAISQLDERAVALHRAANDMAPDAWNHKFTYGGETLDAGWIVAHAVHDATHHIQDVGRGLHALGAGAPTQHGTVVQCSVSGGGVPKASRDRVTVDRRGVVGDAQADRKHHGKPLQALSLWSLEVIEALRAEGHPIHAGAAGENVTLTGIDWTTIRPGVRLTIGPVLVEISAFATPCTKNAQWFSDREFRRIDHERNPGWSRAYAWVLRGGELQAGDEVVVEP